MFWWHHAAAQVARGRTRRMGLITTNSLTPDASTGAWCRRRWSDLMASPRDVLVIDLFGLSAEEVRVRFPAVFQWVVERVKPERDQNNRAGYRDNWWIFGEPRRVLRPAARWLAPLHRHRRNRETPHLPVPRRQRAARQQADRHRLGRCRLAGRAVQPGPPRMGAGRR
jgi:hypothetical protein